MYNTKNINFLISDLFAKFSWQL